MKGEKGMKRAIAALLLAAVLLGALAGCSQKQEREISCAQVIAAYEAAGYTVGHREYPEQDYGYVCEVTVESGGKSIRFQFYDTPRQAQSQADQRQWNVALWLYSAAMGQPTWLTTTTYRNIEIEYDSSELYKPFQSLLRS